MTRTPDARPARLITAAAWIVVAVSFAHVALDSTRPRSVDIHGLLAVAAVAAVILASTAVLGRGAWPSVVSVVGGVVTMFVAIGLILGRAAHETGLVLLACGAVIVVASIAGAGLRRRAAPPNPHA
jgi:hypothetical protein